MESQLKELKANAIEPISSWMLTCSTTQLNPYVELFNLNITMIVSTFSIIIIFFTE